MIRATVLVTRSPKSVSLKGHQHSDDDCDYDQTQHCDSGYQTQGGGSKHMTKVTNTMIIATIIMAQSPNHNDIMIISRVTERSVCVAAHVWCAWQSHDVVPMLRRMTLSCRLGSQHIPDQRGGVADAMHARDMCPQQ